MLPVVPLVLAAIQLVGATIERAAIVYPSVITGRSGDKQIKFRAFDKDYHLKLETARDIISDNFFIITPDGNANEYVQPDIQHIKRKLYRDVQQRASLYVDEGEPITKIRGVIDDRLRIEPYHPTSQHSEHFRDLGDADETNEEGDAAHYLYVIHEKDPGHLNDAIIPKVVRGNETAEERRSGAVLELICVTDSLFSSQFTSHDKIVEYLTIEINAVQLRYNTLRHLSIRICLVGVIRITKLSDEPYIQNCLINCQAAVLPFYSENGLDSFASHYAKRTDLKADAFMLVTKRPMADVVNGKVDYGCVGIAYVGGCCDRYYRYGISEDGGICFDGACTMAHEACHLLGGPHDEDGPVSYLTGHPGAKKCSWNEGFIMSYVEKDTNRYVFSICSEECMTYFTKLKDGNCLFSQVGTQLKSDTRLPANYLMTVCGVQGSTHNDLTKYYTARCKWVHPDKADIFCYYYPKDACQFSCRTASDKSGTFYYWVHDCVDGDTCGSGKKCINGICK